MRFLQELRQLLGNRIFMAVVVISVVSAEWHSIVSNIAIVFSTITARENAKQAPGRELAIREGAEADAAIKRQTALQAERQARAAADEQEARACQARVEAEIKYKPLQDVRIPDCARLYSTTFGDPVTDAIMRHSQQCVDRTRAFMAAAPDTESAYRAFVREKGSEFEAIKKDCNGSVIDTDAKRIADIVGAVQDHLKPDTGGDACFEKVKAWLNKAPSSASDFIEYVSGPTYEEYKTNCFPKLSSAMRDEVLKLYDAKMRAIGGAMPATGDASSATPAPSRISSPSNLATVLPEQLNVHSAPNADAATVIGKLARGQRVRITGPGAGDFVAIESNCIDGNPCKGYINGRAELISH